MLTDRCCTVYVMRNGNRVTKNQTINKHALRLLYIQTTIKKELPLTRQLLIKLNVI